jgi:hypothetical protein
MRAYSKLWRAKNRDLIRQRKLASRHKNPERYRAQRNAWNRANAEKVRAMFLRQKYGLEWAEYQRLLAMQNGKCAICQQAFSKTPCVDHDHTTGEVRGLLCKDCNISLGLMQDNPTRLRAGADYLESHEAE